MGGLRKGVGEWMMRPNRRLWWIWYVLQFLSSKQSSSSARKVQLIPLLLWLKQVLYENSRQHGLTCVFLELCLRPSISDLPGVMQLPLKIWERVAFERGSHEWFVKLFSIDTEYFPSVALPSWDAGTEKWTNNLSHFQLLNFHLVWHVAHSDFLNYSCRRWSRCR